MSGYTYRAIDCDDSGCLHSFPDEVGTGGYLTLGDVRSAARADGWTCSWRGDFCPDHAPLRRGNRG